MPTFALNFYNPAVAEQLRTGRKTATIRLGDKSAKYRKGMIVTVLCGARYGQRERIFDAVIDKVEVKALGELSPREIEHDNPQIRRVDEMLWFLSQLYNREVAEDEIVTLIRFSQITVTPTCPGGGSSFRRARVRVSVRRTPRTRRRTPTRSAPSSWDSDDAAHRRIAGTPPAARPRRRGSSAACVRTRGRRRPSRRASSAVPPESSCVLRVPSAATVDPRGATDAVVRVGNRQPNDGEIAVWPYVKPSPWARSRR